METTLRGLTSHVSCTWMTWSWLAAHSKSTCSTCRKCSSGSEKPAYSSIQSNANSFRRKYGTLGILYLLRR
jgi:hypothetical protein